MTDRRITILKGWPSIRDYVRLRRMMSADSAPAADDSALVQEWKAANELVQERAALATDDVAGVEPLPREIQAEAATDLDSALARACFGLLPRSWGWVDLRRLIVWQRYVNLGFAAQLQSRLPADPDPQALLEFARGHNREEPPVFVKSQSGNRFMITSNSSDLRVIDTLTLQPSQIQGLDVRGRAAAVVAVAVGYSFNAMVAVQMGNRLVLLNGTHRAYALRSQGITHAPCIVRYLKSAADVELVAPPPVGSQTLSGLLVEQRPPIIEDFFDQRLTSHVESGCDGYFLDIELTITRSSFRLPLPHASHPDAAPGSLN